VGGKGMKLYEPVVWKIDSTYYCCLNTLVKDWYGMDEDDQIIMRSKCYYYLSAGHHVVWNDLDKPTKEILIHDSMSDMTIVRDGLPFYEKREDSSVGVFMISLYEDPNESPNVTDTEVLQCLLYGNREDDVIALNRLKERRDPRARTVYSILMGDQIFKDQTLDLVYKYLSTVPGFNVIYK
jgi:hypothetical protein